MTPPTARFVELLKSGSAYEDDRIKVRFENDCYWLTDLGGFAWSEQTWTESLVRELVAVRLTRKRAAQPIEAFLSVTDASAQLVKREPELAELAKIPLDSRHIVSLCEAYLRSGKSFYRCNHEGFEDWSYDAEAAKFVYETGGENGNDRSVSDAVTFSGGLSVVDGMVRAWSPSDLRDARDALAGLGYATFRAWAAKR